MELEKRKRGDEKEREEGEEIKKVREEVGKGEGVVPSEEEVEEFFAILRRMKVAVKYFERGGNGEGWRAALGTEDGGVVDDDEEEEEEEDKRDVMMMKKKKKKGHTREEESGILDLNATPEEGESNIGA